MNPGTYLQKRREAAGLSLDQVARSLSALPWAIRAPREDEIARLVEKLRAVEAGAEHFTALQVALVRNAFTFDPGIYAQLVDLAAAGRGSGLPEPQVCRSCACSWHDPCSTDAGPCAWSARDSGLCTRCAAAGPATSGPAPVPLSIPGAPA